MGIAIGFVGNYAPCGLSPQTDGMPVIPTHGTGLIPSASAMEIQIGVSMAATLPFCIKRVRTLVSMVITTVRTITEALSPPNKIGRAHV